MGDLKGLSDLFSQVIIVNGPDLLFAAVRPPETSYRFRAAWPP